MIGNTVFVLLLEKPSPPPFPPLENMIEIQSEKEIKALKSHYIFCVKGVISKQRNLK